MKRLTLAFAIAGIAITLDSGCSLMAVSSLVPGYLTTPKGDLLLSQDGQCWRTAEWRPALAIRECDPEIVLAREQEQKKKKEEKKEDEKKPEEEKKEVVQDQGEHPGTEHEGYVFVPPETAPVPMGAASADVATAADAAAPAKELKMRTEILFAPLVLNSDASFRFNDDHLTQEGKDAVTELAGMIKARHAQDLKITVEGYTDRIGSAAKNLDLSRRRADAVKAALVNAGIPATAVEAVGKGATQPVTQVDDCPNYLVKCELIDCLRPDRRVEIKVRGRMENGKRQVPVEGSVEWPRPRTAQHADDRREEMRAVCKAG